MLNKKTFLNKNFTFKGQPRAYVKLKNLDTLWFNTGTLCNLQCKGCYIESSPKNDSILYIKFESVREYINEIIKNKMKTIYFFKETYFPRGELPFLDGKRFFLEEELYLFEGFLPEEKSNVSMENEASITHRII